MLSHLQRNSKDICAQLYIYSGVVFRTFSSHFPPHSLDAAAPNGVRRKGTTGPVHPPITKSEGTPTSNSMPGLLSRSQEQRQGFPLESPLLFVTSTHVNCAAGLGGGHLSGHSGAGIRPTICRIFVTREKRKCMVAVRKPSSDAMPGLPLMLFVVCITPTVFSLDCLVFFLYKSTSLHDRADM